MPRDIIPQARRDKEVSAHLQEASTSYEALDAFLQRLPTLKGQHEPQVKITLDELGQPVINPFAQINNFEILFLLFRSIPLVDRTRALYMPIRDYDVSFYDFVNDVFGHNLQCYFMKLLDEDSRKVLAKKLKGKQARNRKPKLLTVLEHLSSQGPKPYLVTERIGTSIDYPGLSCCVCGRAFNPSYKKSARQELLDDLANRYPFVRDNTTVRLTIVGSGFLMQSAVIAGQLIERGYRVELDLIELKYSQKGFTEGALRELRLFQYYFQCEFTALGDADNLAEGIRGLIQSSQGSVNLNLSVRIGSDAKARSIAICYRKEGRIRELIAMDLLPVSNAVAPNPMQVLSELSTALPVGSARYVVNKNIVEVGRGQVLSVFVWKQNKVEAGWERRVVDTETEEMRIKSEVLLIDGKERYLVESLADRDKQALARVYLEFSDYRPHAAVARPLLQIASAGKGKRDDKPGAVVASAQSSASACPPAEEMKKASPKKPG